MVQILQNPYPSFGEQVSSGLKQGLDQALSLKQLRDKHDLQQQDLSMPDYQTVSSQFGKEFADLYKAASTGGKTELLKAGLDATLRGENIKEMFSSLSQPAEEGTFPNEKKPSIDVGSEEFFGGEGQKAPIKKQLTNYNQPPKGFTRKEWAQERKGWIKTNNENLKSAREHLKGNKRDVLGTKKLTKLNESHELPEGLERWIINPKTGEIRNIVQLAGKAPTAAQEWTKEIARFGNRAKDAYGSRVTNFDLMQYMKQFPSLLNTSEGRKNILKMMEVNYELDSLYDTAIQTIIDKYGASNIPPEEADRLARERISSREKDLEDQYINLESENENLFLNRGSRSQSSGRPSLTEIFG